MLLTVSILKSDYSRQNYRCNENTSKDIRAALLDILSVSINSGSIFKVDLNVNRIQKNITVYYVDQSAPKYSIGCVVGMQSFNLSPMVIAAFDGQPPLDLGNLIKIAIAEINRFELDPVTHEGIYGNQM